MADRDGPTVTSTSANPFAPALATCADVERLVPGSVEALRGDAERIDASARSLAEHADDLRRLAPDTWTGDAADGWTRTRTQLADALQTVSDVHATAGAVLRAHADTITAARSCASLAVELYERGCALTRAAGLVVPLIASAPVADDPGTGHREAGEAALLAARQQVASSGRAAGAVLDELCAGMPDGRWRADDFVAGLGSWVAGTVATLWRLSAPRMLVDGGGYARDLRAQVDGVHALWSSAMADPVGAVEQLAGLQTLHDRPARWWGELTPDLALTAVGGAGRGRRRSGRGAPARRSPTPCSALPSAAAAHECR